MRYSQDNCLYTKLHHLTEKTQLGKPVLPLLTGRRSRPFNVHGEKSKSITVVKPGSKKMAEVMAFMMANEDLGEDITLFMQNSDDEEDDDLDMDEEDEMYMLYDDEPPSYDVVARLKEVNEALQKEIIPPGYEDRNRKVTFQENPIYLEIYSSPTGYSDDDDADDDDEEDNEKDVDEDDGYGDSTETSDELPEENGHQTSEEVQHEKDVNNLQNHFVEVSITKQICEDEPPAVIVESDNKTVECSESSVVEDSKTTVDVIEPHVENTVDSVETVDPTPTAIENSEPTDDQKLDSQLPPKLNCESLVNVEETPAIIIAQTEKVEQVPVTPPEIVKKVPQPNKLRQRSSSVPPRTSTCDVNSMIMTTKGKFHMMTTDDIQVRGRTSPPSRSSRTLHSRTQPKQSGNNRSNDTKSPQNGNKKQTIPKVDSKTCKLNARNSRPSTTEVKLRSPPSFKEPVQAVVSRAVTTMPKYRGGGPSKYGLTAEQKMEKKLNASSVVQNVQGKKQESLAEKTKKREEVEEAYKLWLQRKLVQNSSSEKANNVQQTTENGKVEQRKSHSGPAFDEWLLMKRRQKRKEAEMERMKRKVEMEISYVKNAEQNRRDFNKWSNQKKCDDSS